MESLHRPGVWPILKKYPRYLLKASRSFRLILLMSEPTSRPELDIPYENEPRRLEKWSAYPLRHSELVVDHHSIFVQTCRAYDIGARIPPMAFRQFSEMDSKARYQWAMELSNELLRWYNALPVEMRCEHQNFCLSAHHVDLV